MSESQDRLTIVKNIYHEHPGEEPFLVSPRFSRWLESSEQTYMRRCRAGKEPAFLDFGWIDVPGYIIISNLEGTRLQVQPTQDERTQITKRVLHLGYRGAPDWQEMLVHPGESVDGSFQCPGELQIFCAEGTAEFRLVAIPR